VKIDVEMCLLGKFIVVKLLHFSYLVKCVIEISCLKV